MFKSFKTSLALILALVFAFSAVSCGKDNSRGDAVSAESSDVVLSGENKPASDVTQRDPNYKALNYDPMKAIWISQWDTSIFVANDRQRDKNNYKSRVEKICKAIAENGFNTVVLQLRPNGDSYFPSEYFPSSEFVVGKLGREFTYDPIEIFIKTAHKYKLSFHAWINPMRLMKASEIENVDEKYPVGKWYRDEKLRGKFLAVHTDKNGSRYYLVPGYEETRRLVADGVVEICKNYDVDAVHIDDYFYPTLDPKFDASHYETVKDEYASLGEYRREKVDQLVYALCKACKSVSPDILFGISPQASVSNNMQELFANVVRWTSQPGFCDYMAPQVYWGFEHPDDARKFDLCCEQWEKMCTEPSVRLVIGLGIYRARGASEDDEEFSEYYRHKDVIKRQLEYLQGRERVSGFIMFSYQDLFDSYGRTTHPLEEEFENFRPVLMEFKSKAA